MPDPYRGTGLPAGPPPAELGSGMPDPYGDEWAGVPGYRRHPWRVGCPILFGAALWF